MILMISNKFTLEFTFKDFALAGVFEFVSVNIDNALRRPGEEFKLTCFLGLAYASCSWYFFAVDCFCFC